MKNSSTETRKKDSGSKNPGESQNKMSLFCAHCTRGTVTTLYQVPIDKSLFHRHHDGNMSNIHAEKDCVKCHECEKFLYLYVACTDTQQAEIAPCTRKSNLRSFCIATLEWLAL